MIWRTGLAPWEIEFLVPGSLICTFLEEATHNTLEPEFDPLLQVVPGDGQG